METTKNIDQDVEMLHGELDRHDGKRHCDKRCKYIVGGILLLALMFVFGVLTRPAPVKIVVAEVKAVLDPQAPRVLQPEIAERLAALHQAAQKGGATMPTLLASGTLPLIISWTPAAVGKQNSDGSVVPVVGSYELPAGWYGAIRLLSDGEVIGAALVDSRTLNTAAQGRFSITPDAIDGEHLVRLSLDAVKGCRITCAADNQLCIATNVNHCQPQYDNQAFLSYLPTVAEAQPPLGSCVEKIFVAGPKYAPQIPEDYNMCAQGKWDTNIAPQALTWLIKNHASEVKSEDTSALLSSVVEVLVGGGTHGEGRSGNLSWTVVQNKGDAETQNICSATLKVRLHCTDGIKETPKAQASGELPHKLSFLEKVKEAVIGKTAYASGNCSAVIHMSGISPSFPFSKDVPVGPTVVANNAACIAWANTQAVYMTDSDWASSVAVGSPTYVASPPSPGICGPADGGVSATMPGAKCTSTWGSTVGPNTPTEWKWTCLGDSTGPNANCSSLVIPSTAPTSPVGNWYRYQGDDCDNTDVGLAPASGWIGACPFNFFSEPSGQWGPACDNSAFSAMYGGPFVGTWNCQVLIPPGYAGSGYGCNPPYWLGGGLYHNYSCNGSVSPIPGVCGTGAGVPTSVEPTGGSACGTGTLISNIPADTATDWKWTCNGVIGSGGGPVICTAPVSSLPITPPVPDLVITPDPVDFGTVPTGSTGITRSFVIKNDGGADFSGVLYPPSTNGLHEAYTCGVNTVIVAQGNQITKTCILTTTIVAPLGGTALISGGGYSKNFSVTATADARTRIEITPSSGSPITVSPYVIPVSIPQGSPAVSYDFEIRNTGSASMTYSATVSGTAGFTIVHASPNPPLAGTPCTGSLANGEVDICRVTFTPGAGGPVNATITFDNQSAPVLGTDPVLVQFLGSVTTSPVCNVYSTALPNVDPAVPATNGFVYDFGPQAIGTPVTRTIYIANTGTGVLGGTLSGPTGFPSPFSVSPSAGLVNVPVGTPLPVTVTFNPQGVAPVSGTVTITGTNASNFPGGVTITVQGSGIASPSLIVSVPPNHDFGSQDISVGPAAPWSFTIRNNGSAASDVTLSVIPTGGTNPAEFTVAPGFRTIPADNLPYTFTVTFNPDTIGNRTANILITPNNAPQQTVSVWGAGINTPANMSFSPALDFGRVIVGRTKTITANITNNDSLGRSFGATTLSIQGSPVGTFTCTAGCGAQTFPLGTSRQVTVTFTPTVVADYPLASGIVLFFDNNAEPAIDNYTLPITGRGVRPLIKYEEN